MLSFDDAQQALTAIADRLPAEIYQQLNGGILLLPDVVLHPQGVGDDLYVLGRYHYDPMGFGRYIAIYFGSFQRVHGWRSREAQIRKLEEVLRHELVHHLEHQAGDRSLEMEDAKDIAKYRSRKGLRKKRPHGKGKKEESR